MSGKSKGSKSSSKSAMKSPKSEIKIDDQKDARTDEKVAATSETKPQKLEATLSDPAASSSANAFLTAVEPISVSSTVSPSSPSSSSTSTNTSNTSILESSNISSPSSHRDSVSNSADPARTIPVESIPRNPSFAPAGSSDAASAIIRNSSINPASRTTSLAADRLASMSRANSTFLSMPSLSTSSVSSTSSKVPTLNLSSLSSLSSSSFSSLSGSSRFSSSLVSPNSNGALSSPAGTSTLLTSPVTSDRSNSFLSSPASADAPKPSLTRASTYAKRANLSFLPTDAPAASSLSKVEVKVDKVDLMGSDVDTNLDLSVVPNRAVEAPLMQARTSTGLFEPVSLLESKPIGTDSISIPGLVTSISSASAPAPAVSLGGKLDSAQRELYLDRVSGTALSKSIGLESGPVSSSGPSDDSMPPEDPTPHPMQELITEAVQACQDAIQGRDLIELESILNEVPNLPSDSAKLNYWVKQVKSLADNVRAESEKKRELQSNTVSSLREAIQNREIGELQSAVESCQNVPSNSEIDRLLFEARDLLEALIELKNRNLSPPEALKAAILQRDINELNRVIKTASADDVPKTVELSLLLNQAEKVLQEVTKEQHIKGVIDSLKVAMASSSLSQLEASVKVAQENIGNAPRGSAQFRSLTALLASSAVLLDELKKVHQENHQLRMQLLQRLRETMNSKKISSIDSELAIIKDAAEQASLPGAVEDELTMCIKEAIALVGSMRETNRSKYSKGQSDAIKGLDKAMSEQPVKAESLKKAVNIAKIAPVFNFRNNIKEISDLFDMSGPDVSIRIAEFEAQQRLLAEKMSAAERLCNELLPADQQEKLVQTAIAVLRKAIDAKSVDSLSRALTQARSAPTTTPSYPQLAELIKEAEPIFVELSSVGAELNPISFAHSNLLLMMKLDDHPVSALESAINESRRFVSTSSKFRAVIVLVQELNDLREEAEKLLVDWRKSDAAVRALRIAIEARQYGTLKSAILDAQIVTSTPPLRHALSDAHAVLVEVEQLRAELLKRLKSAIATKQITTLYNELVYVQSLARNRGSTDSNDELINGIHEAISMLAQLRLEKRSKLEKMISEALASLQSALTMQPKPKIIPLESALELGRAVPVVDDFEELFDPAAADSEALINQLQKRQQRLAEAIFDADTLLTHLKLALAEKLAKQESVWCGLDSAIANRVSSQELEASIEVARQALQTPTLIEDSAKWAAQVKARIVDGEKLVSIVRDEELQLAKARHSAMYALTRAIELRSIPELESSLSAAAYIQVHAELDALKKKAADLLVELKQIEEENAFLLQGALGKLREALSSESIPFVEDALAYARVAPHSNDLERLRDRVEDHLEKLKKADEESIQIKRAISSLSSGLSSGSPDDILAAIASAQSAPQSTELQELLEMSHKELIAAKLREAESKVTQVAIDRIRSAMEAREIDQLRVAISIGQVSPPSEELAQLISLAQTLLDQLIIEREQEIVTNGALIALQKALSSKILSDLTSALNQARSAPTNSPSSAEMLNLIPKAETLLEEIKLAAAEFNLIADSKLGLSNALEDTKHASEPLRRAIEVSHKVKISSIDHDVVKSFAEHQELLLKAESTLIDWIKTEDAVEILKQAVSAHQFGILQNAIKVAEYVLPSPALLSQSELAQKILAELLQFRNEILTRLKDALFARQIIELAHAVDHAKAHSAPILTTDADDEVILKTNEAVELLASLRKKNRNKLSKNLSDALIGLHAIMEQKPKPKILDLEEALEVAKAVPIIQDTIEIIEPEALDALQQNQDFQKQQQNLVDAINLGELQLAALKASEADKLARQEKALAALDSVIHSRPCSQELESALEIARLVIKDQFLIEDSPSFVKRMKLRISEGEKLVFEIREDELILAKFRQAAVQDLNKAIASRSISELAHVLDDVSQILSTTELDSLKEHAQSLFKELRQVHDAAIGALRDAIKKRQITLLHEAIAQASTSPQTVELQDLIEQGQNLLYLLNLEIEQELSVVASLNRLRKAMDDAIIDELNISIGLSRVAPTKCKSSAELLALILQAEELLAELKCADSDKKTVVDALRFLNAALENPDRAISQLETAISSAKTVSITCKDKSVKKLLSELRSTEKIAEETLSDWRKSQAAIESIRLAMSAKEYAPLASTIKSSQTAPSSPALEKTLGEAREMLDSLRSSIEGSAINSLNRAIEKRSISGLESALKSSLDLPFDSKSMELVDTRESSEKLLHQLREFHANRPKQLKKSSKQLRKSVDERQIQQLEGCLIESDKVLHAVPEVPDDESNVSSEERTAHQELSALHQKGCELLAELKHHKELQEKAIADLTSAIAASSISMLQVAISQSESLPASTSEIDTIRKKAVSILNDLLRDDASRLKAQNEMIKQLQISVDEHKSIGAIQEALDHAARVPASDELTAEMKAAEQAIDDIKKVIASLESSIQEKSIPHLQSGIASATKHRFASATDICTARTSAEDLLAQLLATRAHNAELTQQAIEKLRAALQSSAIVALNEALHFSASVPESSTELDDLQAEAKIRVVQLLNIDVLQTAVMLKSISKLESALITARSISPVSADLSDQITTADALLSDLHAQVEKATDLLKHASSKETYESSLMFAAEIPSASISEEVSTLRSEVTNSLNRLRCDDALAVLKKAVEENKVDCLESALSETSWLLQVLPSPYLTELESSRITAKAALSILIDSMNMNARLRYDAISVLRHALDQDVIPALSAAIQQGETVLETSEDFNELMTRARIRVSQLLAISQLNKAIASNSISLLQSAVSSIRTDNISCTDVLSSALSSAEELILFIQSRIDAATKSISDSFRQPSMDAFEAALTCSSLIPLPSISAELADLIGQVKRSLFQLRTSTCLASLTSAMDARSISNLKQAIEQSTILVQKIKYDHPPVGNPSDIELTIAAANSMLTELISTKESIECHQAAVVEELQKAMISRSVSDLEIAVEHANQAIAPESNTGSVLPESECNQDLVSQLLELLAIAASLLARLKHARDENARLRTMLQQSIAAHDFDKVDELLAESKKLVDETGQDESLASTPIFEEMTRDLANAEAEVAQWHADEENAFLALQAAVQTESISQVEDALAQAQRFEDSSESMKQQVDIARTYLDVLKREDEERKQALASLNAAIKARVISELDASLEQAGMVQKPNDEVNARIEDAMNLLTELHQKCRQAIDALQTCLDNQHVLLDEIEAAIEFASPVATADPKVGELLANVEEIAEELRSKKFNKMVSFDAGKSSVAPDEDGDVFAERNETEEERARRIEEARVRLTGQELLTFLHHERVACERRQELRTSLDQDQLKRLAELEAERIELDSQSVEGQRLLISDSVSQQFTDLRAQMQAETEMERKLQTQAHGLLEAERKRFEADQRKYEHLRLQAEGKRLKDNYSIYEILQNLPPNCRYSQDEIKSMYRGLSSRWRDRFNHARALQKRFESEQATSKDISSSMDSSEVDDDSLQALSPETLASLFMPLENPIKFQADLYLRIIRDFIEADVPSVTQKLKSECKSNASDDDNSSNEVLSRMRQQVRVLDFANSSKLVEEIFQTMLLASTESLPSHFSATPELLIPESVFVENFHMFYGDISADDLSSS